MPRCVFCHLVQGHEETCPQTIPTTWGPGSGPWPELARTMLKAWRQDSCVYDRGGPEEIRTLEDLWDRMELALGTGQAEEALGLLSTYYGGPAQAPPPTEGPAQG